MSYSPKISTKKKCKDYCKIECLNWKKDVYSKLQIIINTLKILCLVPILILSKLITYDSEISGQISTEFQNNFFDQNGFYYDFYKCNSKAGKSVEFGNWQGTVNGCGAEKNGIKKARIKKEGKDCKKDEIFLQEISSQKIDTFKGITVCGTTENIYYDYLFNNSVVEENQDCPEGLKNCGYIDTVKNKLCLKKNEQCPISYIKIVDKNTEPPKNISNLKEIKYENISFYYSNDPYDNGRKIPYIQYKFKITDSNKICSLPNLQYSSSELFILDKMYYSSDCKLKDNNQSVELDINSRYHKVSEINQYELYKENGIIDTIINNKLNDYGFNIEKYRENILAIYVTSHFGFNKSCLKNRKTKFERDYFSKFSDVSDNMFFWGKFIFWFYIGAFGLILSESFNILKCNDCELNVENIIKICINILCSLITFFYSFIGGLSYDNDYEESMECSDIVSNSNFNVMIYKVQKNGKIIQYCCYIILSFLLLNLSSLIVLIIQCSCDDYLREACRNCCCSCCIKCCSQKINQNNESLKNSTKIDQSVNEILNKSKINPLPINNITTNIQSCEPSKNNVIKNNENIFKNKA